MKVSIPLLTLTCISLCGCGKPQSSSLPPDKLPGGGTPGQTRATKPEATQPGGSPASPQAFANDILANQQKVLRANQSFAAIAEHYRKDPRRFSGDMLAGTRNHVNELKGAREELSQLRMPASPEGKAFYEAYQQLLDNQIKKWDAEGHKPAQDPARAKEFDQFMSRLQEQQNTDLARVKEAQQAFLNAQ